MKAERESDEQLGMPLRPRRTGRPPRRARSAPGLAPAPVHFSSRLHTSRGEDQQGKGSCPQPLPRGARLGLLGAPHLPLISCMGASFLSKPLDT